MAGVVGGNVNLVESSPERYEAKFVMNLNLGGFTAAGTNRDTYLRYKIREDDEISWLPQYYVLGRFLAPFGVSTDEHRAYARMITKTSWHDLDAGLLMSGDPSGTIHYDIGLLSGEKNGGSSIASGGATRYGYMVNLRWMPSWFPATLGLSANYYRRSEGAEGATASSLYALYSLTRSSLLSRWIRGSIAAEYVTARQWNESQVQLVSSPTYLGALKNERAEGWYSALVIDLNPKVSLVFRYDRATLDVGFPSDFYERTGIGIKHYVGPNMSFSVRTEFAKATHPTEANGTATGAQNATWLLMQVAL